ncbi:GPI-anchored surface protein, putative [Bodo saltans]|uniref:GPI-anchored surface protein, putative n=1 Tax=Bodo saltans TaxID=75058 RepID=A0A0S4ITH6_BODSA|nr:GPI-anchored surface protein, putative [Bodo saltans]|eukprot:CUF48133.1 GPI-anchored surface protein, putative [Bodo saltans]
MLPFSFCYATIPFNLSNDSVLCSSYLLLVLCALFFFFVRLFSHFVAHCPFHDLLAQNDTNRRDISTETFTFTFTHIDCTTATMNPCCCRLSYFISPTPIHTIPLIVVFLLGKNKYCCSYLRPLEQEALLASRSSFFLCFLYKTFCFLFKNPSPLLRALSTLPFPPQGTHTFCLYAFIDII